MIEEILPSLVWAVAFLIFAGMTYMFFSKVVNDFIEAIKLLSDVIEQTLLDIRDKQVQSNEINQRFSRFLEMSSGTEQLALLEKIVNLLETDLNET